MRILLGLCALTGLQAQPPVLDKAKLIDMSYAFDEKTIYWPTAKPFERHKDAWGMSPGGYFYASATFTTSEHGGTHLDSPLHFGEGKWSNEQIPLDRLFGPARVIDISATCAKDRDYRLTPADILAYEKQNGRIDPADIVLVHTGWGRFWPDKKAYLGCDRPGDTSCLSFPGLGEDAARLLVERKIAGIGIDTASIDYGKSKDFRVHRIVYPANIFGLENVAQMEKLPARGAWLIALPVKVTGGTGGPVRIVGVIR